MYPLQKKFKFVEMYPSLQKNFNKISIKMYPTSQKNLKVISWDVSLLQKKFQNNS